MNTYHAFYRDKQIEAKANSSYAAQKLAAQQFKAKKSFDVSVVLVTLADGARLCITRQSWDSYEPRLFHQPRLRPLRTSCPKAAGMANPGFGRGHYFVLMKKQKTYYHFTSDQLRDGRPIPPVGEWLIHEGPLEMCCQGLHASAHPFDALTYAPGPRLHRVELDGEMLQAGDKVCARKRKILKSIDATDLLQKYARRVASDAVEQYWPEAPEVVVHFLKTGEQAAEAGAAAWAAWAAAEARAAQAAQAASAWAAADAAARAVEAAEAAAVAARAAEAAARAVEAVEAEARAVGAAAWAAWAAAEARAAQENARKKYRKWFQEMVAVEFSRA